MTQAKKKTLDTYTVDARVVLLTSVDITANSLQDALSIAEQLDWADFADAKGEVLDASCAVSGLWKKDGMDL